MKILGVVIAVFVWGGIVAAIDDKIYAICPADGWALPILASIPLAIVGFVTIALAARPHSETE